MKQEQFTAKVKKEFPYAYSLVPDFMWEWIFRQYINKTEHKPEKSLQVDDVRKQYKKWLKDTERGGSVITGKSMEEFFVYLKQQQ